jgi:glutaredoxin
MDRLKRRANSRHITLYGKPGCHLCDDARELLAAESRRHALSIREVDITQDPAVFRAYDIRIPVIVIDDMIQIEAPITARSLRDALGRS